MAFKLGSQNNQLVRFLFHEKRSITRQTAMISLGIANLTARITELRDAGYQIDGTVKVDMRGHKYVAYSARIV
jgi:hypothetical protein